MNISDIRTGLKSLLEQTIGQRRTWIPHRQWMREYQTLRQAAGSTDLGNMSRMIKGRLDQCRNYANRKNRERDV